MCKVMSRSGGELSQQVYENRRTTNGFDILVRTPDKKMIFWFHGKSNLNVKEALSLAEEIPQMEYGCVVICVKEI